MSSGLLAIGIVLVLLGTRFGYGALRTYRNRDLHEDAGSWFWGAAVLGVFLILLGGVLINFYLDDRRTLQEARERIAVDDAVIRSFSATGTPSQGFDVEIEVANRSPLHHLISVTLDITGYDCEGPEITPRCNEVLKQEAWFPVDLPPQDSGMLRRSLAPAEAVEGNLLWEYRVIQTMARE